jgi:DNA-binding transcriptional LysR family regulator
LSRQIRRLEQQIGVRLFDRTPQRTRLTEAGEVFLSRAKALLQLDVAVLPGGRLLGCG